MSTLNDEWLRVFGTEFGNVAQLAFLTSQGFADGDLQDRWMQFLEAEGYAEGAFNDRLFAYLRGQP